MPDFLARFRKGAKGELQVAIDLFDRGYFVYSPMNILGPCDLIALRDNIACRVEVKTSRGYNVQDYKFDVLALVALDGKITYIPDIATWFLNNAKPLTR